MAVLTREGWESVDREDYFMALSRHSRSYSGSEGGVTISDFRMKPAPNAFVSSIKTKRPDGSLVWGSVFSSFKM